MQVTGQTPVGEIVAADFRTAAVFHEFGIDFCCSGATTLGEACRVRHLDEDTVLNAVERSCDQPDAGPMFDTWDATTLIGFIVGRHHDYVKRALPSITAHAQKIAAVHGGRHPELHEVARLADEVAAEMTAHMAKEERMLFPYISALDVAARDGTPAPAAPFGPVDNPIRMMEAEHKAAGDAMARIRVLTRGYAAPDDGCTTYRVCLQELDAFERDLHAHVHLENNLLFPKARALAAGGQGVTACDVRATTREANGARLS
jgi:regulator of cell morphogenesis and NO signaling